MGEELPKYLNSPETTLFNKGHTLFALDKAKKSIQSLDKAVVVEGYFDVISLHSVGITNAVASLGTAFSKTQLNQLLRYTDSKQVIFNFDADGAGIKATQKAISEIESLVYSGQVQLRVLNLPDGKDADEFLKSHANAVENYQQLIENAPLWFDWQIQQLLIDKDLKQADHFQEVAQAMLKLLNNLNDSNKRTYYISYCAEILSQGDTRSLPLYTKNLQKQLRQPRLSKDAANKPNYKVLKMAEKSEDNLLEQAEKLLLIIYLHRPEYRQKIFDTLAEKELVFSLEKYRILWQIILEVERQNNRNNEPLISLLQEKYLQLSLSNKQCNEIFNLSENRQEDINCDRVPLLINSALISMEKARLEKYSRYCYQKHKSINPNIDFKNKDYYLQEYIISREKSKTLDSSRSFSQLDIYQS